MYVFYFLLIVAWVILILGYKLLKDFTTTVLGSILLIIWGIFGLTEGFNGWNNLISQGFSIIHIGLGLYWTVKSSIKLSRDPVEVIYNIKSNWRKKWKKQKK
jgi:hypothetical protein